MFSLTVREQFLVTAVLFALVGGTAIHHWRVRSTGGGAAIAALHQPNEKKTLAADETP